jgi:hypothetical protein
MLDSEGAKIKSTDLEATWIPLDVCTVPKSTNFVISSISGCAFGMKRERPTLGTHYICKTKQRIQLRRVLSQSAITRPLGSKSVLDDVKRMLNLRSNTGLELLELLAQPSRHRIEQRTALPWAQRNIPHQPVPLIFSALLNELIARITESCRLITVQQRMGLGDVAEIRSSGDQRIGQSRIRINTNVRLHFEVPMVTLLGLMHLQVARYVFVFCRGRRFDALRIHGRAFLEQQFFGRQKGVDGKRSTNPMLFRV